MKPNLLCASRWHYLNSSQWIVLSHEWTVHHNLCVIVPPSLFKPHSDIRSHLVLMLRCCRDQRAPTLLIICHLTVYQSQGIPPRLCDLWIFLFYGVINFPWIISLHADPCFDKCSRWIMHTMCFLLLQPLNASHYPNVFVGASVTLLQPPCDTCDRRRAPRCNCWCIWWKQH